MQLVYSKAQADWALLGVGVLPLCRDAVGAFYSPSQLGLNLPNTINEYMIIYFQMIIYVW